MALSTRLGLGSIITCASIALGCGSEVTVAGDSPAVEVTDAGCDDPSYYPAGPYGFTQSATVGNFRFVGMVDYGEPMEIRMCDFYNPNRSGSLPRALLLHTAAVWESPPSAWRSSTPLRWSSRP